MKKKEHTIHQQNINEFGLVCKVLSLTGNEASPNDLEACHQLKKKENVIIKFKSRKLQYKIINNRKIMKNKSKERIEQIKVF